MRVVVVIGLLLAMATPIHAHPLDMGYLKIESTPAEAGGDPTLTIVMDLEATVGAKLIGTTPEALAGPAGAAHATELAEASYRKAPITTNAGTCKWTTTTIELLTTTKTLRQTGQATCPAGSSTLRWELPVITQLESTFEMLTKSYAFGNERITMLRRANTVLEVTADEKYGFMDLIWSGVEHIGAAPGEWHDTDGFKLADGVDHVLFLLALLLAGGTLWQLLGIATGFTLGHSVTLALGMFGIVQLPASIVEPLIALTIAATAVDAVFGKPRHRWKIATAFGFIHGFAFANALAELQLATGSAAVALFGFNLGVELGQIVVILVVAPMIMALHRYRPDAARWFVRIAAGLIFIAGIYWFIQRTFM